LSCMDGFGWKPHDRMPSGGRWFNISFWDPDGNIRSL